jgi:hypothetical protein
MPKRILPAYERAPDENLTSTDPCAGNPPLRSRLRALAPLSMAYAGLKALPYPYLVLFRDGGQIGLDEFFDFTPFWSVFFRPSYPIQAGLSALRRHRGGQPAFWTRHWFAVRSRPVRKAARNDGKYFARTLDRPDGGGYGVACFQLDESA